MHEEKDFEFEQLAMRKTVDIVSDGHCGGCNGCGGCNH
jgi:hypothetical protein